jgi:hypothetical protein
MSQARTTTFPNERGMFVTSCAPCEASAEFPTLVMAVEARRLHLCEDEVPSCSWPGWALGIEPL